MFWEPVYESNEVRPIDPDRAVLCFEQLQWPFSWNVKMFKNKLFWISKDPQTHNIVLTTTSNQPQTKLNCTNLNMGYSLVNICWKFHKVPKIHKGQDLTQNVQIHSGRRI